MKFAASQAKRSESHSRLQDKLRLFCHLRQGCLCRRRPIPICGLPLAEDGTRGARPGYDVTKIRCRKESDLTSNVCNLITVRLHFHLSLWVHILHTETSVFAPLLCSFTRGSRVELLYYDLCT
jgi:hypothetical protein